MTYDTLSTIGTLIFYAVLLIAAYVTGVWLVRNDRKYKQQ